MTTVPELLDPVLFQDGVPYEYFARLRATSPVHWQPEPEGGAGFWSLTRHHDIKAVEADSATFSSEPSTVIVDSVSMAPGSPAKHLIMSDPPHHTEHRKVLGQELAPLPVRSMRDQLGAVVDEVIDEVIEAGQCDIVADLGGRLASYVTADLLGISREEAVELCDAADVLTRGGSKEEGPGLVATQTMFRHAAAAWEQRQDGEHADLLSRIARAEILGQPVDQVQFSMDFLLLVAAGSDTTRNVVATGMAAFFEHPDQWRRLVEKPDLIPGAVEEVLRWSTPIVYQRRTATRDTVIGDQAIRAGDKVVSWYAAGNRDPEVFSDPDRFDITRAPNPHLAFGAGRHFCLGSHLARLELALMFEAIARRMPDLRPDGGWEYRSSPIVPSVVGPARMPARFTSGRRVA